MSFASDVKVELAKLKIDDCCKMASLSALLQLSGEMSINSEGAHVCFKTMNNTIARLFVSLVKDKYDLPINILVSKQNLTKNDVFNIVVDNANSVITDFDLFNKDYAHYNKYVKKDCCKKSYIRGAFLATGSINDPKKSYHLEIKCRNDECAIFIQMLLNSFRLNARISKRRDELIVYIKEAQAIADFLYIIGANKSYFDYEDIRVDKDISNLVNRKNNCEIANEVKAINAAKQQIEDIKIIENNEDIDPKLVEVMEIRKKNPTATLVELLEVYKEEYGKEITKSCLNHRFRRIHELASDPEKK
ncbi:MAG: DNA-binding protein WhiA [Acholeplasmatales bacterium]|nr:DNA-binding protein WhiA [Acholeplasmatales bacterium]